MKIIFVNGPIGVGKSTLVKGLHEALPGQTLLLNVDKLRNQISKWRDDKLRASEWTARSSIFLIQTALENNYNIICDKVVVSSDHKIALVWQNFFDEIEKLSDEMNVAFHEIFLTAKRDIVFNRYEKRNKECSVPVKEKKFDMLFEGAHNFAQKRAGTHIIDTTDLSEDEVLENAVQHIKT